MKKRDKEVLIYKASGEMEPFSEQKLRESLNKAKIPVDLADETVEYIKSGLSGGMTTANIYKQAFAFLRAKHRVSAARYDLKRAIMKLGPTGRPFEKFVGGLLESEGFAVEIGKTISGFCVSHEIDVIANKDNRNILVECKFHNQGGIKSDVKIALYVQARFEDIEKKRQSLPKYEREFHEIWLVTNTKLTTDAIKYANCVGMRAIAWSYPHGNSLQNIAERSKLHPITCLIGLGDSYKRRLLDMGVVFCKEIIESPSLLKSIGFKDLKIEKIMEEIKAL